MRPRGFVIQHYLSSGPFTWSWAGAGLGWGGGWMMIEFTAEPSGGVVGKTQ